MTVERVVIVGAGECGTRAAITLRERGFSGSITLVGEEPGAPYERPPLSKSALFDPHDPVPVTVCTPARFGELDIDFMPSSRVVLIDRAGGTVGLGGGRSLGYDRLLLATGARARTLPIPGGDHAITLRTYVDAMALRRHLRPGARVVVIGAGFIGLETAAAATARGCQVTVIEIGAAPMGRAVPGALADILAARHRQAGVDLRLGVGVESIAIVDDHDGESNSVCRYLVTLTGVDRAAGEEIAADIIVAGIGAIPNSELAESAGLDTANGIVVDEHLATGDRSIFAAGDCCSFPHPVFGSRRIRLEAWRNAQDQAVVAAHNLLGADEVFRAVPWFWSDQYELGLQIAGMPDMATDEVVRFRSDGWQIRFGTDADGRMVSASAVAPGTSIAKDIRIAEMLIGKRAVVAAALLADPTVSLKSLLKSA